MLWRKVKELTVVETISIRCECEHFVDKYRFNEPSDIESCFSIVPVYDLKFLAQEPPPFRVSRVFRSTVEECLYNSSGP